MNLGISSIAFPEEIEGSDRGREGSDDVDEDADEAVDTTGGITKLSGKENCGEEVTDVALKV